MVFTSSTVSVSVIFIIACSWTIVASLYVSSLNGTAMQYIKDPEDIENITPKYYMNLICKEKILLNSRRAVIISPWVTNFPPATQQCIMGVEENAYRNYKLVLTFKTMNLYMRSSGICDKSRLDVYDGQSIKDVDRITGNHGLCGTDTEKKFYETTKTNFVILKYITNNLPANVSQYFEAVITPYHYGSCEEDEFRCSNNKCILNDLRCDSYNNCGDDSDETCNTSYSAVNSSLSTGAIIGIIIGSLIFCAMVVAIIVAVVMCGVCNLYRRM
ncbi:hypothetical protein ACF0H5_005725 [Mactra antiquata]